MSLAASPSRPHPAPGAEALTAVTPVAPTEPQPVRASRGRWTSLDAMRALALFGMVAHHVATWTSGQVRQRWIGFEDFAVTDLAAPMFAIGVGAAAYLVGTRVVTDVHPARVALSVVGKWIKVLLLAMGLELAVQGRLDGGGVLYTLFVVGLATTALVAVGLRSGWAWWAIAVGGAALAGPATHTPGRAVGALDQLWSGNFAVTTYVAFAAAGAAVTAMAGRGGEAALPLWRATAGVVAGGTLLAIVAPSTAPDGVWPPSRHPGDLAFIVWGMAGTFAVWAVLRAVLRGGPVTDGLVRAGQRTLLVFALHYCIRIVMGRAGLLSTLDTRGWGLVTWGVIIAICLVSMMPKPAWVERRGPTVT